MRLRPTGLLHQTDGLQKLILDNPKLPLLIFANEYANTGDYSLTACSCISANIGEYLDCIAGHGDKCYTDRDDFEEDIADILADDYPKLTDEEFEKIVKEKVAQYDEYWTKCIILTVGN
jgi:hypothetical protein